MPGCGGRCRPAGKQREVTASVTLPVLRVLWARWCLASAAAQALEAGGLALPAGFLVDGAVARYRASSGAGATLTGFGGARAVLSCGDRSWRVSAAPSASERLAGLPDWVDHPAMLDHRVRAGHFGWVSVHGSAGWTDPAPPDGAPLPPLLSTAPLAGVLAGALGAGQAQRDVMFHLIRMAEYQFLDVGSWRAALDPVAPADAVERGWECLRDRDLVRIAARQPITAGVLGRGEAEATNMAVAYTRRVGAEVPAQVRVTAGFRREFGWDVRIGDYRDAGLGTALTVVVDDDGAVYPRAGQLPANVT